MAAIILLVASCGKTEQNPLLSNFDTPHQTPPFGKIKAEHYEPAFDVAIEEAKKEQAAGAGLILWTCRAGKELDAAIAACKEWGLNFDTVNQSLPEWIEAWGSDSRKVGADEYWDDKAVIADTTCILRSATCYQRKNK